MRRILYSTMVLVLMITFTGLPAYGYGGGGGDGDSMGTNITDMGDSTGSKPPDSFTPIVIGEPSPEPPPGLSSVESTRITNETIERDLSPEELQQLQAAFDFIMITTGGVILGYSTAAAGWSVLGQATASGVYAGLTTYATSDDKAADKTTKAAIQDFIIGFIPVSPIGQAAISQAVNKLREVLPEPKFNREGASLAELRQAYRGF